MDPSNLQKQNDAEEPRFLDFPHLPDNATQHGKKRLNKYSSNLTKDHDFPGAQVGHESCVFDLTGFDVNSGNAVRGGRARPRDDEEQPSCRSGFCLVGGKPLQVSLAVTGIFVQC